MGLEKISLEELNRLYIIKHHLFQKASRKDVVKVADDVCGLHAQVPSSPYLSLWSRVENFENDLLDNALYRDKTLVKTWFMRGTLHVIPSDDLPIYNKALKTMWFEHHARVMREPDAPSIEELKTNVYPKILQVLAQKPLKRSELSTRVRSLLKDDYKHYQRLFSAWGGILKETSYEGLTVHAQPCQREACFARVDKWLPHTDLCKIGEEEAQKRLFTKYLRGYGPATQQDFALWSGLMAGDARRAIENAGSSVEEVEVEGAKGRLWLSKEDRRTLDSIDLDERVPVSLLPKFDSILLGHKDRTRIVRDEHKKRVFKPIIGDIAATVLVNGRVVGTWRPKKTKHALTVIFTPFEKIAEEDLKEIEERAKALSQFMGFKELKLSVAS